MPTPTSELRVDCARDQVMDVIKAALACGYDVRRIYIFCRNGFVASDGDAVFSDEVRLVRTSRGSFPLVAWIDQQDVRVAPTGNCSVTARP